MLDLDLHGNHAHSGKCKATLAGRGLRHKLQKNVVSYHAAKAGCIASWVTEDSTPELLLHEYSAQECSTMFPTRATAALAQQSRQLRDDLRDAAKLPPSERENKLRDLKQRFEPLLQSVKNGKGLRIDGTIMHPASGEVVWYDTTSVHSTCKKYLTAEVPLTRKRLNAGKEAETPITRTIPGSQREARPLCPPQRNHGEANSRRPAVSVANDPACCGLLARRVLCWGTAFGRVADRQLLRTAASGG